MLTPLDAGAAGMRAMAPDLPLLVCRAEDARYTVLLGAGRLRSDTDSSLLPCQIISADEDSASLIAAIDASWEPTVRALALAAAAMSSCGMAHADIALHLRIKDRADASRLVAAARRGGEFLSALDRPWVRVWHLKRLAALPSQEAAAILRRGRATRIPRKASASAHYDQHADPDLALIERDLSARLNAGVKLDTSKRGAPELVLGYTTVSDLLALLESLGRQPDPGAQVAFPAIPRSLRIALTGDELDALLGVIRGS